MKYLKRTTAIVAILICAHTANAQKIDSLLFEALKANTYRLKINAEGRFDGTALPVIQKAISESQFLLVGEQHGIVEAATFTQALIYEAKPSGYSYFCIETDPYIASELGQLAIANQKSVLEFLNAYPFSIPFYNSREDFELIKTTITQFGNKPEVLWGIDQIFMGADRYIFSQLETLATTEPAKSQINIYKQKAKDGFNEMINTGNPSKLLLNTLTTEDFESLRAAFDNQNPKAIRIIDDLEKSQAIYKLWMNGKYYENNRTRMLWMKAQFMEYYTRALSTNKLPKVVFKFGQTHTYRGLSMYDQFDIGNLASELAEMNGSSSVHFAIQGVKGHSQGPFGPAQSFENSTEMNQTIYKAIEPLLDGNEWIVIDMRPLRNGLSTSILNSVHKLVFGYDFWIYVPNAQPVNLLGN